MDSRAVFQDGSVSSAIDVVPGMRRIAERLQRKSDISHSETATEESVVIDGRYKEIARKSGRPELRKAEHPPSRDYGATGGDKFFEDKTWGKKFQW
jgi:hypothetical protein